MGFQPHELGTLALVTRPMTLDIKSRQNDHRAIVCSIAREKLRPSMYLVLPGIHHPGATQSCYMLLRGASGAYHVEFTHWVPKVHPVILRGHPADEACPLFIAISCNGKR